MLAAFEPFTPYLKQMTLGKLIFRDSRAYSIPLRVALLTFTLSGCVPLSAVRSGFDLTPPSYRVAPGAVQTEYVSLPGFDEPNTPDRYDRAFYLRYFAPTNGKPDTPHMPGTPKTVVVLMPGLFAGATSLDLLARQLVASRAGLEVWAVDRRANALEDRGAMAQSIEQRDPQLAYDYYVANAGRADGFTPMPPSELRFTAFWGLEVHLRDLHEVVKRADAAAHTVILGGHSLGGSLVNFYSSYDLAAGTAVDPGYSHVDGLLLLDGLLGVTGGFGWEEEGLTLGEVQLISSRSDLEAGRGDPEREVTHLDDYVRSKSNAQTNSSEWYFPLRLGLDMVQLDVRLDHTPHFVPTRSVPTPTLAVGAERGLVQSLEFSAYRAARGIGARFST